MPVFCNLIADEFNARHAVGTRVRYWPLCGESDPPPMESTTRTEAWTLGHGTPVVAIVGKSGGVALDHLEILPDGR